MNEVSNNPLGLEIKLYSLEEFGSAIRSKFGGDNYISNVMLAGTTAFQFVFVLIKAQRRVLLR